MRNYWNTANLYSSAFIVQSAESLSRENLGLSSLHQKW